LYTKRIVKFAYKAKQKFETLTIEKSRVDKLEEKIRRIEKMYR